MNNNRQILRYHWPHSRSAGVHTLLEELDANYKLEIVDIRAGKRRDTDFINERTAVYAFLADLYADRGLAPAIDEPLHSPYDEARRATDLHEALWSY